MAFNPFSYNVKPVDLGLPSVSRPRTLQCAIVRSLTKGLVFCGLATTVSCTRNDAVVRIVVPDRYVGPLAVRFDQPDGADLDQKDGATTFRFSTSGTLSYKQSLDEIPHSYDLQSIDYSGHKLGTNDGVSIPENWTPEFNKARRAAFANVENDNSLHGFAGSLNELRKYLANHPND